MLALVASAGASSGCGAVANMCERHVHEAAVRGCME